MSYFENFMKANQALKRQRPPLWFSC